MKGTDEPPSQPQQPAASARPTLSGRQGSVMNFEPRSLSYHNMILNIDGSVLSQDLIKGLRERQGYCVTCPGEPVKLYEIRKSKLNPLWKSKENISVMHESYNGVCLKCNPQMDPFKEQRRTSLQFSLSAAGSRGSSFRSAKPHYRTSDNLPGSLRSSSMSREGSLRSVEESPLRSRQERYGSRDSLTPSLSPAPRANLPSFDVTTRDPRYNSSLTSHDLTESNGSCEDSSEKYESSPEISGKESVFSSHLTSLPKQEGNDWDNFSMPDFSQGSSNTFKSHRQKPPTKINPQQRLSSVRNTSMKRNSLSGIRENSVGELQRSANSIHGIDHNMDVNTREENLFDANLFSDSRSSKSVTKKDKSDRTKKKKKDKEPKDKAKKSKSRGKLKGSFEFIDDFATGWPEPFNENQATNNGCEPGFETEDLFGRSNLFESTSALSDNELPVQPISKNQKRLSDDSMNYEVFHFESSSTSITGNNSWSGTRSRNNDSNNFAPPPLEDEAGGPDIIVSRPVTLLRKASPSLTPPPREANHALPDDEEDQVITRKTPEDPVDHEKLDEINALLKDVAAAGSMEFLTELLVNTMRSYQDVMEIQELCLSYIWDLCKFNDANKSAIMSAGLPEDIIKAMKLFKQSVKVQECACGALWSLSVNQFNRIELVRIGAVERIFRALEMHLKMEAFVEVAFGALRTLSPDPEVRVSIGQLLGAHRVCRAMGLHRQSTSIQRDGCAFLSNVAVDMENQVVSIVTFEELEAVVRAMGDHLRNEAVLASACFALKNYTYEEKNLRALRQFDEASSLLEDASKYSSSIECRNDAAETLDRIRMLQAEDEALEEMAYSSLLDMEVSAMVQSAEDSVMSIIDILREYEWSVRMICYCLDSLHEMAKRSEEHVVLMTQNLSLRVVINAMERQRINAKVQEKGCELLKILAMHSAQSRSSICDVNGSNFVLTAMRIHRGVETVQMAAFAALKALSDDPRCAKEVARIGGLTRIRDAYQERSVRETLKDERSIRSLAFTRSSMNASIQMMGNSKILSSILLVD